MTSSEQTHPTFLLVDGHSLAFRAFYAFGKHPEGGLRTSTGIPTSICFGFLKALIEMLDREKPAAVAIAFDLAVPTFRHEIDDTYKANRSETPESFIPDMQNLQRVLAAMNLPAITQAGFEADDVLGTLSQAASAEGYTVKILSGDRDLFQLIDIDKRISVLNIGQKDKIVEYHADQVKERLGVLPTQVVDYKALCGDASDNIPGVRGIGEKTAIKLIEEYGSLENVLAAIPKMKGAVKTKLEQGIEAAKHSQFMATIKTDVPLPMAIADCELTGFDTAEVIPLLEELELKAFVNRVDQIHAKLSGNFEKKSSPPAPLPKGEGSKIDLSQQQINEEDEELWFDFAKQEKDQAIAASASLKLDVQIIDTIPKLEKLCEILSAKQPVAWDTETSALNPFEAELVGIGCCWGDSISEVAYIPLSHSEGCNLKWEEIREILRPILEDASHPKYLQNAKFDRLMFKAAGIELAGVTFDTMIASYVIDPEASHKLDDMAMDLLQIRTVSYKTLVGKRKSIAEVAIPLVAQYCGMDTYLTYHLVPILRSQLTAIPELWDLFQNVEMALEPILAEMEWRGIRIDREFLSAFSLELEKDLDALAIAAYAQAGKEFNLNSPKQLSEILLEKLGGKFEKASRKSKTGFSTDVTVLNKLEGEPLIDTILENRTLAKLKSTYVDALPSLIQPKTGRVHTDFNQTVASTGRLSSSNPNLQNIPIRTVFSKRIRAGFLPKEDWILMAADYSQIELRILAHLSQEPELMRAFNAGEDVHTVTAQLLLEKEEVTSDERRLAKIINYGVIYGMGAQKFSRDIGVPVKVAKQFIDKFNQRYEKISSYMQSVEAEAERNGYVKTILGRRRYFRGLSQIGGYQKAALLRSAVNAPIQGTSADIIKVAMLRVNELLSGYQTKLLLQVHDELVFEVPPDEVAELQPKIKAAMESALELSVKLEVDIHTGKNWMEAK
ncbi:MAG: DNA polymerase I [Pseudanabaena sp.]|jgi:DNA polymerase-1|nr:DNA polymerase I [Pseudanabaena sp. M090S1SP2A07QC]MCA6507411.1 DNA polymerase I [Pseudanabaena sp. M172S2SP2A07QC]MCA6518116.1 DNA polymerase I [Pseudanabaena sp. M110S1SP2A07QC]MCA6520384.1 DNA polymerase I [Pseudanabaena sp. M051S1SP2A07QC]MCA6527290.1 DNA polymerase I [Pseudanabaena sp. M179S2SP2A07QC]MCA6528774.1 DNA polymerase I [Pseudanabaena sp. M125S2SP2A07QC]MCA6533041.1 DNA polymerase I [Pseudanabaena sp. M176S2SP2A07QC]MCA6537793.1 DNA polymerase I [Pseudanabaena sp. M037S2SP2